MKNYVAKRENICSPRDFAVATTQNDTERHRTLTFQRRQQVIGALAED